MSENAIANHIKSLMEFLERAQAKADAMSTLDERHPELHNLCVEIAAAIRDQRRRLKRLTEKK